jgi:hypothetical protein
LTAPAQDAGMMTQQLGFSILAAPLAAIDRRALSQAWYSALHLARERTLQSPAPPRNEVPIRDVAQRTAESHESTRAAKFEGARRVREPGSKPTPVATPERRATRSALARRIERTFLHPIARPKRATFTVDGTRARVHVALQTTPNGVRIVAVCPASVRGRVARALDQARFALAARGIALQADVTLSSSKG